MATIYDFLNQKNFDFDNGIILYQPVSEQTDSPGKADVDQLQTTVLMPVSVLHKEFDDGLGSPQCPRFIAYDKNFIYFPTQSDGATDIAKVGRNIEIYLNTTYPTPYCGE